MERTAGPIDGAIRTDGAGTAEFCLAGTVLEGGGKPDDKAPGRTDSDASNQAAGLRGKTPPIVFQLPDGEGQALHSQIAQIAGRQRVAKPIGPVDNEDGCPGPATMRGSMARSCSYMALRHQMVFS